MTLTSWALLAIAAVSVITSVIFEGRYRRAIEANQCWQARFDGSMRTLSALASESDDHIASITVERCDQCPHCREDQ